MVIAIEVAKVRGGRLRYYDYHKVPPIENNYHLYNSPLGRLIRESRSYAKRVKRDLTKKLGLN